MNEKTKAAGMIVLFLILVTANPSISHSSLQQGLSIDNSTQNEDDSDGDGFSDLEEQMCNSDLGNAASTPKDTDSDGVCDYLDQFPDDPLETSDIDNDGIGDNQDKDDDNDGEKDETDDFQFDPCRTIDTDSDGFANFILYHLCDELYPVADDDDDNDGVLDLFDVYPLDPCGHTDTDGDGLPDDLFTSISYPCRGLTGDPDDDNDGYLDLDDAFPLDSSEWADNDQDGVGDNADINDDNDAWSDLLEFICGTDPYNQLSFPIDTDGDGQCDVIDSDDDNDGVLDIDDDDPLNAPGSWEWSFVSGDILRINDVAPDQYGNFFVTGTYIGNTTIGGLTLTSHNLQDAFVAKFDSEGNALWAKSTTSEKKLCANDMGKMPGSSFGLTWSVNVTQGSIWEYTNVSVDSTTYTVNQSTGYPDTGGIIINSTPTATNPVGLIEVGDRIYTNQSIPYEYLGVVKSVLPDFIELEVPYTGFLAPNSSIVVLDEFNFSTSSGVSIPINQGLFTKMRWTESYAEANAIVVDANGDAYITGNFVGFIKFEKPGFDRVIKSYNVRAEGEWLRERYMYDAGIYQDKLANPNLNNYAHAEHAITGYPCGAPDTEYHYGTDMFVAKIDSNGDWEWVSEAGTMDSDTGDVIAIDENGEYVYVAGHLRHSRVDHIKAHYCYDPSDCDDLSACENSQGICEFNTDATNPSYAYGKANRNGACTPSKHVDSDPLMFAGAILHYPVKNHAGMFAGVDGAPELNGCGAYLAKIKASNGKWKHAEQISPPIQNLERQSGTTQGYNQGADGNQNACIAATLVASTCSDMYVHITGIEVAGSPERVYISGKYAVTITFDDDSEFSTGSLDKYNERGFVVKYSPATKEWNGVLNGCGISKIDCDEIHDIETDGINYFYISGCYMNQNFIARYDFSGQEIWFKVITSSNPQQSLDTMCQHTEIGLDSNGEIYLAGAYWRGISETITFDSITLPPSYSQTLPAMPNGLEWKYAHFVAHIDKNGTWLWAQDSPQIVFQGHGHPGSLQASVHHPTGWPTFPGGIGSSRPTGLFVDNGRVVVTGWLNGAGVFKDVHHTGKNSYWAAVDGPLQYEPPSTTIATGGDPWDLPSISMSTTIIMIMFTAIIFSRNSYQWNVGYLVSRNQSK